MTEAERLHDVLRREAPAAARCLSPLGLRAAFPRGIPFQTAQARSTEINATIGQVTDDHGAPMALSGMTDALSGVDAKMAWLYPPAEGHLALRQAWAARQRGMGLGSDAVMSTPMVVHGLTQGVSLVADLFADPDTDVFIPDPCWENYHLVFQFRPGANVVSYPFFRDGRFNLEGLADALAASTAKKAVIVLNFPSNPTGYTPTVAEGQRIAEVVLAYPGPAVVLCDDAYQGMVWEDGLLARSLYWDLAERADPERLLVVKTDGATKELFFFGGRMAFLSASVSGAAEDALLSKWKCIARSTNGVCAGPSQALVLKELADPRLEADVADRLAMLARRWRALTDALMAARSDKLDPFPSNSGVFSMVRLHGTDAEALRARLITEFSVGTIALPSVNALRIAFCSVPEAMLPELVRRLQRAVA